MVWFNFPPSGSASLNLEDLLFVSSVYSGGTLLAIVARCPVVTR